MKANTSTQPVQKRPKVGFFLGDLSKSIRRRHRQMLLLGVISFLSAFFLLGMYLFQENSESYQFAARQAAYGDWCIAEIQEGGSAAAQSVDVDTDEEASAEETAAEDAASFRSHSYFNQIGYMESGITVYNSEGVSYDAQIGYMDETLLSIGAVSLYEGHFPESDTEIVITSDLLADMGYSLELGQSIVLYSISDELTADGELTYDAHTFTLVGILQGSCQRWVTGEWMPDALMPQSALAEVASMGNEPVEGWFYQLKEEFSGVDATDLYENLSAALTAGNTDGGSTNEDAEEFSTEAEESVASSGTVGSNITLYVNDSLYSDSSSDSSIYYLLLKLLISAAAATALSFLLISYIQKRRPEYYRFRTIGMSRRRVYLMMWVEGLFACIPSLVVGLVLAAVVGRIVVAIVCACGAYQFQYEISVGLVFSAILIWIATFVLAMLLAMAMNWDRSLQGNVRPLTISDKVKKHRNRLHPKHILLGMDIRSRKVHRGTSMLSYLLGVLFLGLFLFGGVRILEDYLSYALLSENTSDFVVSLSGGGWRAYVYSDDDLDEDSFLSGSYLEMGCGFTDDFLAQLDSISQITYNLSTRDTTHLFEWDGMWDSGDLDEYLDWVYLTESNNTSTTTYSIRNILEKGYELQAMGYTSWFVSNTQEIYEKCTKLCKKNSSQGKVYDYDKFENGEQVFLFLSEDYESIEAGDTIRIYKSIVGEDADNSADTVIGTDNSTETVTETGTGDVLDADSSKAYIEVIVAGIIIDNDDAISMQFPISIMQPMQFSAGIFLVGSEALGRQIAQMDGTEYASNYLTVDVSQYASNYVTIKECAELFANTDMRKLQYMNYYETLQQEWKEFLQTLGIYGVFLIFLLAFYLMLKLDMTQTEISRQSERIRLLRRMGMEKKRLGRMYALDGVLESWLLWLPPIVVWIIRYVMVKSYIFDVDEYQSLWKIYLPFAIISVAGMLVLHMGVRYFMIRRTLKKE